MIDTHTADGIKVGIEQRRPNLPLVCLETALPAKFAETIQEALGREPGTPASIWQGIEKLPQRCEVMDADVAKLKAYISARRACVIWIFRGQRSWKYRPDPCLPVPCAATRGKKKCPRMHASGFMNAGIAARCSNPKPATAVSICSYGTVPCPPVQMGGAKGGCC